MADPYLYEGSTVLRNKLDILDEKTLDLVEAEQSRATKEGSRTFLQQVCVRYTSSCSGESTHGPGSIGSSISKSENACWVDEVCGIAMMRISRRTWNRHFSRSTYSSGSIFLGMPLSTTLRSAFQGFGRFIRSVKETPEQSL